MNQIKRFSLFCFAYLACFLLLGTESTEAQNRFGQTTSIQVQLPVVSFFNVNTVVSVPDGGTMSLGGISRYSAGRSSRGIPGLGGPLFRNTGSGFSAAGSRATVTATVISNREIEETLWADGNRQAFYRERRDPNGTPAVQAKADFISRNIGRSRR